MSRMSEANPRQSLVKGERLIRYELASAMGMKWSARGPVALVRAKIGGRLREVAADMRKTCRDGARRCTLRKCGQNVPRPNFVANFTA